MRRLLLYSTIVGMLAHHGALWRHYSWEAGRDEWRYRIGDMNVRRMKTRVELRKRLDYLEGGDWRANFERYHTLATYYLELYPITVEYVFSYRQSLGLESKKWWVW